MLYDFNKKNPESFLKKKLSWVIDYVGATKTEELESYPEAHTHGLADLGHLELQVRFVPMDIASYILNTIGAFIASGGKINKGDEILIGGIKHIIQETINQDGETLLKLTWFKDPL